MHNPKADFPLLMQPRHKPLVYLDSAATTQKPLCVIQILAHYYTELNASPHRGIYDLSEQSTEAFEQARTVVQKFINAPAAKECIFVKNATEAINLVASSFSAAFLEPGDEILISAMEHHANIVPWQWACKQKGAHLKVIPISPAGDLVANWATYLSPRTKLLAITQLSNVLGTLNPIADMIQTAHAQGVPVLVDAAQSAPHLPIDVQALDCDFLTFSGHKIYGPTGIGILYGKSRWLEAMPPYQGGGHMILKVDFEQSTYQDLPHKFEAGTPPIAAVLGLARALEYVLEQGWSSIQSHEKSLLDYALQALSSIPDLRIIGQPQQQVGVLSFIMNGIHPHDIGSIVDQSGIAIRTGHHCAMPLMNVLKVPATARVSFGFYNNLDDIDTLCAALETVHAIFRKK